MADEQRTEKPTKRRIDKARREGRFPVSRDLVGAAQLAAFAALAANFGAAAFGRLRLMMGMSLAGAFRAPLTPRTLEGWYADALFGILGPALAAGAALSGVTLAAQLASTRLGISLHRLSPDPSRLNPLKKAMELPRQNLASTLQALLLFPLLGLALYSIAMQHLPQFLSLPVLGLPGALPLLARSFASFLWKAALAMALLGLVDFVRQQRRHNQTLRMSKHEVRQEAKESEGNPETKSRIRRIQREVARRNMMKEVPRATAVIVNPTHYSVAIRYELDAMAAPRVVAKGKNYLALRIRQIAAANQVPIVENQPLAQALYKSADVGQEIPPQLYRAVAEILAYLFRLMHPRGA